MHFFKFSLMGCLIFSLTLWADDMVSPSIPDIREVDLEPERIYVPKGFDSNDNSEVVITGWYPNPCYEWSRAIVEKTNKDIEVTLKAFVNDGGEAICIDVAMPYMESIKLGYLNEGYSRIIVNDELDSSIHVATPGSSTVDNHIYGKVTYVRAGGKSLILGVELPSPCITLDTFKTIFNGKDTCAVLPIMKQTSESCPRKPEIVEYTYEMPEEYLIQEKTLFHIRSAGGRAVNFLFENKE